MAGKFSVAVTLDYTEKDASGWIQSEVRDHRVLYEGEDAVEAERVWRAVLNDTVGAQGSQG